MKKIIIVFFSISCILYSCNSKAYNSVDLQSFIAAAKLADRIPFSGRGTVSYVSITTASQNERNNLPKPTPKSCGKSYPLVPLSPIHSVDNIRFYFHKEKYCINREFSRYEILDENMKKLTHHQFLYAYNGVNTDMIHTHWNDNEKSYSQGEIYPGQGHFHFFLSYYFNTILGTPISCFLEGNLFDRPLDNLNYIGKRLHDNFTCYVFEGVISEGDTVVTTWLSPDLSFRPIKTIIKSNSFERVIVNTINRTDMDMQFPRQITIMTYECIPTKKKNITKIEYYVIRSVDFNISVPDDAFTIEFPSGIEVADRRGKPYKIFTVE